MSGCETAEDTLEYSDVVITGVQPGQPLPASLTSRVANFRAMVLQPDTWLDNWKTVRRQWPDVQVQEASSDCGLFAIMNSLTLCRGFHLHCQPASWRWMSTATADGPYGKNLGVRFARAAHS
ncbi:hypothetical protein JZ751_005331 [Albula glossodonta]|uniref:Uncharacterized protein n=1 Tax=Albula glossodonta TaxID=121402 RepID=A0A8T2N9H3_9TELE|nr:hypothetical protein JZ751_005331 [Albula glossodonta]